MDAMPVSGTLSLALPVTGGETSLGASVLEARKKLVKSPVVDDVVHYVGTLFALYRHARHFWARLVEEPSVQIEWTFAERTVARPSLEKEIMMALSFLCSTLGARAEALTRQFKAREAERLFLQCAFAFEVLAAFSARAHTRNFEERDAALARARLARLFAWHSQFVVLLRDRDVDRVAVGLGLAAEYWRLAHAELALVPACASLAVGYAHYCLMLCAGEQAAQLVGASDAAGKAQQEHLHRLECLYALAALEAERAAKLFDKKPQVADACLAESKAMRKKQEATRDERFKWILILAQNEIAPALLVPVNDEKDHILPQGVLDLFKTKPAPAPVSSALIPLDKNPVLQSIETAAHAWLHLQGGPSSLNSAGPSERRVVRAAHTDVSKQLAATVPGLVLTQRDELVMVLGRMTERLQWMKYTGSDVLILASEREQLEATIAQLVTLLKSQKNTS